LRSEIRQMEDVDTYEQSYNERVEHLTQGITPNEMVEVITELTNP